MSKYKKYISYDCVCTEKLEICKNIFPTVTVCSSTTNQETLYNGLATVVVYWATVCLYAEQLCVCMQLSIRNLSCAATSLHLCHFVPCNTNLASQAISPRLFFRSPRLLFPLNSDQMISWLPADRFYILERSLAFITLKRSKQFNHLSANVFVSIISAKLSVLQHSDWCSYNKEFVQFLHRNNSCEEGP